MQISFLRFPESYSESADANWVVDQIEVAFKSEPMGSEYNWKFVIMDHANAMIADTRVLIAHIFSVIAAHSIAVAQVMHDDPGSKLVGAGEYHRTIREFDWGSVTCKSVFGLDRPNDPAEADRVLEELKVGVEASRHIK